MGDYRLQHLGPSFPTLIRHNSATSPDIVINRYGYFNYRFTPGSLTTSDHLPVIMEISTNPILIPTTPRSDYKNADWDKYKEIFENKLSYDLDVKPSAETDLETNNWFQDILEAKEASILVKTHRTTPYPSNTPDLQLLQTLNQGIRTLANIRSWNQELRQQYCRIRGRLVDTCRTQYNSKWAELTAQLSSKVKDQKEFWRQLKTLMGNDVRNSPYLLDSQGNKHYRHEEKELVHRTHWRSVFHISDEENQSFDRETEERVMEDIREQTELLNTDPMVNLQNLSHEDPLISPISVEDVTNGIKHIKNEAPGLSQIRKTELLQLPPIMIHRLASIYNVSLASGYFPKRFKTAVIALIPKAGKPPNKPENFRPISLLEIPGKIFKRIINKRLKAHLEGNNLLNDRVQHSRSST